MKYITYLLHSSVNYGTASSPKWEDVYLTKVIPWSEHNEEIAKQESHDGTYTIEY